MRPEIERAVGLIQRNDPQSLERAIQLLQKTIFLFSMKVCGQREDAEDTTQEVLLQSIPNLPKFDNPRALVVWLYKVAKTRCLMSRRKSKFAPKQALSLDELMPDGQELQRLTTDKEETPETAAIRRENARRLREAIQKLPPEYRLVLVLHDMEELSDSDIAEITGLRPGTVRVRLHRARLFVRKELSQLEHSNAPAGARIAIGHTGAAPRDGHCKTIFAELSNYLDKQLDDSLCDELEKHIGGCGPCQAFLQDLQKTIQRCRTDSPETPDPEAAAHLRQRVLAEYQKALANVSRERVSRDRS